MNWVIRGLWFGGLRQPTHHLLTNLLLFLEWEISESLPHGLGFATHAGTISAADKNGKRTASTTRQLRLSARGKEEVFRLREAQAPARRRPVFGATTITHRQWGFAGLLREAH